MIGTGQTTVLESKLGWGRANLWGSSMTSKYSERDACTNCDAPMAEEYCAACGQRRFRPQDRTLGHLLASFFGAITDLDGRFWRSIKATLLRPGLIARDYMEGRRARWISPVRLFLLANLLYFLAPGVSDLNLPFSNQIRGDLVREFDPAACTQKAPRAICNNNGQWYSGLAEPWLRHKLQHAQSAAQQRDAAFSLRSFAARYNARAASLAKLMVIVHVPFVAAMLWLLTWRRRYFYAEHFVVALGLVTFLLLFVQLVIWPGSAIHTWFMRQMGNIDSSMPWWVLLAVVLIFVGHFSLACRRCYESRWPVALGQGLLAFVALAAASILFYRPLQFLLSLWMM